MQGFILFIFSRTFCYPAYGKALPQGLIPYPVYIPFLTNYSGTSPLRHFYSSLTPPFGGHKIWSRKNVHIISVFVTSIEGKPLFRVKGHFFWDQTLVSPPVRGYLSSLKVTDDKTRCVFTSHNGDSLQNMN